MSEVHFNPQKISSCLGLILLFLELYIDITTETSVSTVVKYFLENCRVSKEFNAEYSSILSLCTAYFLQNLKWDTDQKKIAPVLV